MTVGFTKAEFLAFIATRYFVDRESGCWIWTGDKDGSGYPRTTRQRKAYGIHRLSLSLLKGQSVDGLFACHSCDTPTCINPDHLWAGSVVDNLHDMYAKGRGRFQSATHCKHGHEYTPENIYKLKHKNTRYCRQCLRRYRQNRLLRKVAA